RPTSADTASPARRPYNTPAVLRWNLEPTNRIEHDVTSTVWTMLSVMYFTGWNVTRSTSLQNITSSVNGSVEAPISTYFRYPSPWTTEPASGPLSTISSALARPDTASRNASDVDTMRIRACRSGCS